jgi:N-carbamoyl-L-amino-acid hydrolase
VPAGGRLDGAYGVIAALEVARALVAAGHPVAERLEVVSFADEEGVTGGGGFGGSLHFCESAGLAELRGYLEVHIEQGPRLEAAGLQVGIVETIVGIDRYQLVIRGEANHAGTTPFSLRHDAGRTATMFIAQLREAVTSVDAEMVANVGALELEPGATNVVPGEARFVAEVRSARSQSLGAAAEALRRLLDHVCDANGCSGRMESLSSVPPTPMDWHYVETLAHICDRRGLPWTRMPSGAGHDAGIVGRHVPAGMVFIPSSGGISHSPLESSSEEDLVAGASVLLEAVLALSREL